MIDGVKTKPLKQIVDERGKVGHIMRKDDEIFEKFGEVYLTVGNPGIVKGWHYHKTQTDNFAVVKGLMKLVLYDSRKNSPTKGELNEFLVGDENHQLVKIPPGVVHGFTAIGAEPAYAINVCTEVYNPEDEFRIDPYKNDIPYDWKLEEG
ncbi:MAG: dTDP-4-dehydrorhamnose 3,5-epimerase family protein [archaeon]